MLGAIILFSSVEVASKWVGGSIPPLWLGTVRFYLAGLLLLAPGVAALRQRGGWPDGREWLALLVMAIVGVTLSLGLYHLAIPRMRANSAAILFSANPAFVVLFAPGLLGERPERRHLAGAAAGLAGVGVFLTRPAAGTDTLPGVLLMTGSLICFALYTVLSKRYMLRFGAFPILALAGLLGSTLLLPLAWSLEGPPTEALHGVYWPGVIYLSVFATAMAYALYFDGLHRAGAARGSLLFFLKPILASLFAWVLLGERLTPRLLVGAACVLTGLALSFPKPRPSKARVSGPA